MIYLRLHQAWIEEIASRSNMGNFAIIAKFRYNSEISLEYRIFARIAKFSFCMAISLHSEILLHSEFSLC